jgi:hypothetical protein
MTLPFEVRARPDPGVAAAASSSSTIVFHSPQDAHLPAQRVVTAPQFWQTNAMHPARQSRQQLVADRASHVRQVVDRDAIADHLDPIASLRQMHRYVAHIDGQQVHRDTADHRHLIFADISYGTGLADFPAQCPQEPVGIAAGDRGHSSGAVGAEYGAVADGLSRRQVAHLQDARR